MTRHEKIAFYAGMVYQKLLFEGGTLAELKKIDEDFIKLKEDVMAMLETDGYCDDRFGDFSELVSQGIWDSYAEGKKFYAWAKHSLHEISVGMWSYDV